MQLLKALMLVSTVAYPLDPELAFIHEVKPYLKQLVADEMRSSASMEKRAMDIKSKFENLVVVPKKFPGILEMTFEGKLKVEIAAREVTTLSNTIESATDKIVPESSLPLSSSRSVAGHDGPEQR